MANNNAAKPGADWTQSWSSTCEEMQSLREIKIYCFSYGMIITVTVSFTYAKVTICSTHFYQPKHAQCTNTWKWWFCQLCFSGWWSQDCISLWCIDVSDILGYSLSISNYQGQDIRARSGNIRFTMKKKTFNIS